MKICLCGSTRFMDQFNEANVALSLAGHIVYSVATSTKGDFKPTEEQKTALDAVHLRKIHESDLVMVVGRQEDGSVYIGDSTRREIMYASIWNKPVHFFRTEDEISGPFNTFKEDMEEASMTDVIREELRKSHKAELNSLFEDPSND